MAKAIKLLFFCIALSLLASQAYAVSNQETSGQGAASYSGIVVETMSADGYTYLCIENNGETIWAVVRERPVNIGEEVEVAGGPVMTNFTSESLNRTFAAIIFSRGLVR